MSEQNPGDFEKGGQGALPPPRHKSPEMGETAGASLSAGVGYRMPIDGVSTDELGMDTQGPGQMHVQMPKNPAGMGTRFG